MINLQMHLPTAKIESVQHYVALAIKNCQKLGVQYLHYMRWMRHPLK